MNSIEDIKRIINEAGGLQRTNRFNVNLYSPTESTNSIPAQKVVFGGREIQAISDKLPGPGLGRLIPINIGYGGRDPSLQITFPVEQNWKTYKMIELWMNTLANDGSNPAFFYGPSFARPYSLYAKNGGAEVQCLDTNGSIKATFRFREVYPIRIIPIEMDASISNSFLTYDVIFNFRSYHVY